MQVEDSNVSHYFSGAASLPYEGLAVDQALPSCEAEASNICHHLSSGPATELIHSSGLKNTPNFSNLPATTNDTELDAIFAGKAGVTSATVLNEDYSRPASMAIYESAMPSESAWLADREPATSPMDNAPPHTDAVDRLFEWRVQDQHDGWATCSNFASRDVPDVHELFGGRDHQIASLQASVDADNQAAWADIYRDEPSTQYIRQ